MSLRANFYTFEMKRLEQLLGRGGEPSAELVRQVQEAYPSDPTGVAQKLRRALREQPPLPDLEVEDEAWVCVASTLAVHDPHRTYFSDFSWHATGLFKASELLRGLLSPQVMPLVDFLAWGRPLFGRRIVTDWGYYAWLSQVEAMVLGGELTVLLQDNKIPSPMPPSFIRDLAQVLSTASLDGKDVWMHGA
jgi:hypothetical protein